MEGQSPAVVCAIIERDSSQKPHVLFQTRRDEDRFKGTLQLPHGHMNPGEFVYDALSRVVKEGCGFDVTDIIGRADTFVKGKEMGFAFSPLCCCNFMGSSELGIAFVCRASGEAIGNDMRWVSFEDLKNMVNNHPKNFHPFTLGALKFYVQVK